MRNPHIHPAVSRPEAQSSPAGETVTLDLAPSHSVKQDHVRDVVSYLQGFTGLLASPNDLDIAARLIRSYGYKDVKGAISYVHKADPSRWWVDKIISMENLERHMPTLQKKVIGYRLKNKPVMKSDDPQAKLKSFWANDIGGERRREEVERRLVALPVCADCSGTRRVFSEMTGMVTKNCPACQANQDRLAHELQVEIDALG